MNEIAESAMVTAEMYGGEVYHVRYTRGYKTDIANITEGNVYVSNDSSFEGKHIIIPPECGYNGLKLDGRQDLYIKPETAGKITLVRHGFI
ncbi:MAG: hypothetical protein Q4G33_07545 [bacterium]|nr:hypothetical protein [bacterium]